MQKIRIALENILSSGEKSLFRIYLAFSIFIFFIFVILRQYSEPFLEKFSPGFYGSITASFLEDFIFFVVIGYVTFKLGQRKPEEDQFESRVSALANSPDIKDNYDLKRNLEVEIRKLLSYNLNTVATVIIEEYYPELDAVKLSVNIESKIRNMTTDTNAIYSNNLYIDSDLQINDSFGCIYELSFTDSNTVHHLYDLEKELEALSQKNSYTFTNISKELTFRYFYTINNFLGDDAQNSSGWFYISIARYTANFTLRILNRVKTLNPLICNFDYIDRSEPNKTNSVERHMIPFGKEVKLIERACCYKDDKIEAFFFKP